MFFSITMYFKDDLRPCLYTHVPTHTHTLKKLTEVENSIEAVQPTCSGKRKKTINSGGGKPKIFTSAEI